MPRKTRKNLVGKEQENNEERRREKELREIERKVREDQQKADAWGDLKRDRKKQAGEDIEDNDDE